jgi:hypothetical protein
MGEQARWRIELVDADGQNCHEQQIKARVWNLRELDWHVVPE